MTHDSLLFRKFVSSSLSKQNGLSEKPPPTLMPFPWQQACSAELVLLLPDNITPSPFFLSHISLFLQYMHNEHYTHTYRCLYNHTLFSLRKPCMSDKLSNLHIMFFFYEIYIFFVHGVTFHNLF